MPPRGGFEFMAKMVDLLMQVSRGRGVFSRMNHERQLEL